MKPFFLMRHGATSMAGRFCGHSDPPLNDDGRAQIERAASLLSTIPEVVYSSDLLRARESAEIIAAHFAIHLQIRPGLREINFGSWEGLSWREIEQCFPAESRAWLEHFPAGVIPGGERSDAFVHRVKCEMDFLLVQAEAKALIAVTHGGFIRTALNEMYGVPSDEAFHLSAEYGTILDMSLVGVGTV
jgi:broad specificity phosphatase PhoE